MSNNTTKVNNPMKVITGKDTRWSYANVWEAKSINRRGRWERSCRPLRLCEVTTLENHKY